MSGEGGRASPCSGTRGVSQQQTRHRYLLCKGGCGSAPAEANCACPRSVCLWVRASAFLPVSLLPASLSIPPWVPYLHPWGPGDFPEALGMSNSARTKLQVVLRKQVKTGQESRGWTRLRGMALSAEPIACGKESCSGLQLFLVPRFLP